MSTVTERLDMTENEVHNFCQAEFSTPNQNCSAPRETYTVCFCEEGGDFSEAFDKTKEKPNKQQQITEEKAIEDRISRDNNNQTTIKKRQTERLERTKKNLRNHKTKIKK